MLSTGLRIVATTGTPEFARGIILTDQEGGLTAEKGITEKGGVVLDEKLKII